MDVFVDKGVVYQIKVHYAKNLPKADTFGKIDAYVQFWYPHDTNWSHTSKVINENYDPIWNEKFKAANSLQGDIRGRVMDRDLVNDEQVATFIIPFVSLPFTRKEIELQMDSDFKKKGAVNAKPVVCLSVGVIKSKVALQKTLQLPPSPHFNPSTPTGSMIIPLKDHPVEGLVLVLEYEQGSFDIKLWETKKQTDKFIGLKFADTKNLKYRMRRQTFPSGHNIKGHIVFAETKLDDVPLYKPLDKLVVFVADEALQTNAGDIVVGRGWSGFLDYQGAKKLLKNVFCDDKDTCIYMPVGRGIFRVDWDSDNVDIEYMGQEDAYNNGFVFDIKHSEKHKRTINYFSKPKLAGNTTAIVAASLDDLDSVAFADVNVMEYKMSSTIPFYPVTKIGLIH